jgi:selenocysteine-specific translation elongation factor
MEVVVSSMQIHNQTVAEAKAGDAVGIKVVDKVRHGDKVFKVID